MSHAIGLAECLADGDIQWGGRYLTRETRTASEGGLREGSDSGLYREGFLGENPVGTHPYSAEPLLGIWAWGKVGRPSGQLFCNKNRWSQRL